MAQVKIYALRETLELVRQQLSDAIHSCVREAFGLPQDKRFHRFLALEEEDFVYPRDRSRNYIILEFSIFEGRSVEAKKHLIRLLFDRIEAELGISRQDLEITIFEIPRGNWGIRGKPGDELDLDYRVTV